jgi:hypothetical protein
MPADGSLRRSGDAVSATGERVVLQPACHFLDRKVSSWAQHEVTWQGRAALQRRPDGRLGVW